MIEGSYVSPDKVSILWDQLIPLFEKVLPYNNEEMTLEDIKLDLDRGDMQLFVVCIPNEIVALVTTEIVEYPQHSALNICHCAGDHLEAWIELEPMLVEHAKRNNCKAIELRGRKGWVKKLQDYNYREKNVTLIKEVS